MSGFKSLPDRLDEAVLDDRPRADLLAEASDRICELEDKVLALRCAIAGHRAAKDFSGGKEPCDRRLWEHVADVPWAAVRGDG